MKYECIVVGGGPAGLSAALHLAWHGRKVLVIDRRTGPLNFTLEKLHNVPGLPATSGPGILKVLRGQVEDLGGEILRANVLKAEGADGDFLLSGAKGETWRAQTLLLATGVARYHPTVDGDFAPCFKYAGKGNMYYCPDCEAPEIRDRDTLVIAAGSADGAAGMAVGLSRYTSKLRVLGTRGDELGSGKRELLAAKGIEFLNGEIVELHGEKRELRSLTLRDGREITAEAFFVASPAKGRTDLAEQLGVEMAATGHHAQPASQRGNTNVPGVWIAGDLRPMSQQVAVSMGTGNVAALMIDQTLRKDEVMP